MNVIIILAVVGLATLFTGVYNARKMILPVVVLGLIAAFAMNAFQWNASADASTGMFYSGYVKSMMQFDTYVVAFTGWLTLCSILIFCLCDEYCKEDDHHIAEIF